MTDTLIKLSISAVKRLKIYMKLRSENPWSVGANGIFDDCWLIRSKGARHNNESNEDEDRKEGRKERGSRQGEWTPLPLVDQHCCCFI